MFSYNLMDLKENSDLDIHITTVAVEQNVKNYGWSCKLHVCFLAVLVTYSVHSASKTLIFKVSQMTIFVAVSVLEESWCWENSSLEFEVLEADVTNLQFVQSGFILKCILSHDITLVSAVDLNKSQCCI